ncbi:MAG: hypothetical protein RJB62_808 [Pseudomonadota bacterium]
MDADKTREDAILRGRVAIVYVLGTHYLFLPFAVLCMSAAMLHIRGALWLSALPLIFQIFAAVGANRLKTAYDARDENDDPKIWARRFTIYSAFTGSIWGLGAIIWFVPDSFPAQAYLVLAFLGMTATEFVARGAYRRAYFAHAATSIFPLVVLLAIQGDAYAQMTAILVLFFVGVLHTYSDAIERLLDESILLRYDNARLITRLSEEKKSAELSRDSAQASERSKSAFISSISHEIRTPLNAILGMAQLLERSELEKAQRDHAKVLLESGRGLKILLDDIIALSHGGEHPLNEVPEGGCDAGQAARTVGRLLQPNAWEKRLRLSVNASSGIPRAAADPRILRRVLLKLAGNAIKFTERGNVEISVDTLEEMDGRRTVRFRVTDTGPGIPQNLIGRIFDPFAKADDSYARRYNGAGVGLAVAKRLVEAMSGTIGVESEPGNGATFWIKVPAMTAGTAEEGEAIEKIAAPSGLTLLAFLPDTEMRTTLEHLLTPFNNKISFAASLSETARLAARGDFALVVTTSGEIDALASMPGKHTPLLALARIDDRQPEAADTVLRWPTQPSALYAAIGFLMGSNDSKREPSDADSDDGIIDATTFAELEKSLGFKTLIDILQSYMATAEHLTTILSTTLEAQEWSDTARVAQDITGAAGGLGLTALTSAARALAQSARDGGDPASLAAAAGDVLAQHQRTRDALRRLYPDLAA